MVTALAFAAPTHAMTYSYRLAPNNRIVVNAVGKIEANEPAILTNWLVSLPPKLLKRQVAIFLFNSPGGNVMAAEKLTEAIQGLPEHPDTGVVAGGICASACVLPWSVGTHKYASGNAQVGVHQISGADLGTNLAWNDAMARDLSSRGAPASVVAAQVTTPSTSIHWLTRDELIEWNVEGVTPAPVIDPPDPTFRQAPGMGPIIDHPAANVTPSLSYRGWILAAISIFVIIAYMRTIRLNFSGLDLKPIRTDKKGNRLSDEAHIEIARAFGRPPSNLI